MQSPCYNCDNNCLGLVHSPQLVDYVDFYRKWVSAVQLHQSLVVQNLAISRRATTSAKSSIWSPAHDAERTSVLSSSNPALPSNALVFERCHGDQFTATRRRHAMTSSPEAVMIAGNLLAQSGDNRRAWNQLAALSMYDAM